MKKIFLLLICMFFSLALPAKEKLVSRHQEWLDTVEPIITETERDVFFQLKTEEQRDKFITLFWARRDPLQDTKRNEFYDEYMERVRYANRNFGRNTSKPGSQTERGQFYLILGPPLSREIHTGSQDLLPLELWTYHGDAKLGLPSYFYLIFFQPHGLGEYRLYSPGMDGPDRLLSPSVSGRAMNRHQAYQIIRRSAGELAKASLSYIPDDSSLMTSSLSSDILISKIHELPEKKFTDSYAVDFLKLEDHVETDYLDDYFESRFNAKVFKVNGQNYLHWTLEPHKINFASYEGDTYASFQLITRIEDMEEKLIMERNEEIPLQISPEQYERYNRRIFAFQDLIPVIPGQYRLFLLLKNKTGKDFTSTKIIFSVPEENRDPYMSDLLLYQDRQRLEENQRNKIKAFSFSGYHYLANANNNCLSQRDIGIYAQVYNLGDLKNYSCVLEVYSAESEKSVMSLTKSLPELLESDGQSLNIGPVSLSAVKPGYYHAELSVLDKERHAILEKKINFVVLSQPQPIIPWAYSKLYPAYPNYDHLYMLASQQFRKGQYKEAKQTLEKILKKSKNQSAQLLLARTLLALKQYRESLDVIKPLYEQTQSRESAMVMASNYAELKDWASALIYLEKLLQQSVDLDVLNLAAQCYVKLNKPEKALPLLKKSLELDPAQENIKLLLDQIEKEKNKRF